MATGSSMTTYASDTFLKGGSGMEAEAIFCPHCQLRQPIRHRFCARCGEALPTALVQEPSNKIARFFPSIKVAEGDPEGAFLRVTRYRSDATLESAEGAVVIPGHHVRFSIWSGDQCQCVLSLPESEARELANFVIEELRNSEPLTALAIEAPDQAPGS